MPPPFATAAAIAFLKASVFFVTPSATAPNASHVVDTGREARALHRRHRERRLDRLDGLGRKERLGRRNAGCDNRSCGRCRNRTHFPRAGSEPGGAGDAHAASEAADPTRERREEFGHGFRDPKMPDRGPFDQGFSQGDALRSPWERSMNVLGTSGVHSHGVSRPSSGQPPATHGSCEEQVPHVRGTASQLDVLATGCNGAARASRRGDHLPPRIECGGPPWRGRRASSSVSTHGECTGSSTARSGSATTGAAGASTAT